MMENRYRKPIHNATCFMSLTKYVTCATKTSRGAIFIQTGGRERFNSNLIFIYVKCARETLPAPQTKQKNLAHENSLTKGRFSAILGHRHGRASLCNGHGLMNGTTYDDGKVMPLSTYALYQYPLYHVRNLPSKIMA